MSMLRAAVLLACALDSYAATNNAAAASSSHAQPRGRGIIVSPGDITDWDAFILGAPLCQRCNDDMPAIATLTWVCGVRGCD